MALVGVVVTAIRWLTLDFENDYFMHVAWADEIRRGSLPVRDFVEPGFPLQTLISFAMMKIGGVQLAAEGLVASGLIGVGAACTYGICRRLGVSRGWSLVATAIVVLAYPRLYAYPKAFAYPAALLALAIYVHRPRFTTLSVVALVTAVAFLLRHDHGVWIAVPTIVALGLVHGRNWRAGLRATLSYGLVAALAVLPWFAWIALSGQAASYARWFGGQGGDALLEWRRPEQRFTIDRAAPLVAMAPRTYPEIGIRWNPGASDKARRDREVRYHLEHISGSDDGYLLRDFSTANVEALLRDSLVEDTRGIDRRAARAPSGAFQWLGHRLAWYVPPARIRVLPGTINAQNALPWLTYVTFVLPWVVLLPGAGYMLLNRNARRSPVQIIALATALMSVICYQRIVRGSPDSRIADVTSMVAVLLVYLTARAFALPRGWRLVAGTVTTLVVILTIGGAWSHGRLIARLEGAGVDGPINMARRARDVFDQYAQPPLNAFAPPGSRGLAGLARWLHDCTGPGQRVSVIGFEPEINVWADRGFAGGLAYFDLGWMSDPRDQAVALDRWRRQDVPFVLVMSSEAVAFRRDYSAISDWLQEHYAPVRTSTFDGNKEVAVLIARDIVTTNVYRENGLPCPQAGVAAGTQ